MSTSDSLIQPPQDIAERGLIETCFNFGMDTCVPNWGDGQFIDGGNILAVVTYAIQYYKKLKGIPEAARHPSAPDTDYGNYQGAMADLEELIRVCLTNRPALDRFLADNYPKHCASYSEKSLQPPKPQTSDARAHNIPPVVLVSEEVVSRRAVSALYSEVDCRIEHGAKGTYDHLLYMRGALGKILDAPPPFVEPAECSREIRYVGKHLATCPQITGGFDCTCGESYGKQSMDGNHE